MKSKKPIGFFWREWPPFWQDQLLTCRVTVVSSLKTFIRMGLCFQGSTHQEREAAPQSQKEVEWVNLESMPLIQGFNHSKFYHSSIIHKVWMAKTTDLINKILINCLRIKLTFRLSLRSPTQTRIFKMEKIDLQKIRIPRSRCQR